MSKKRGRKSRKEILKHLIDSGLAANNTQIYVQYELLSNNLLSPGEMIKLAKELPLKKITDILKGKSSVNDLHETPCALKKNVTKRKRKKRTTDHLGQLADQSPDRIFSTSYVLTKDIESYKKECEKQHRPLYKREIGAIRLGSFDLEEKLHALSYLKFNVKYEYYYLIQLGCCVQSQEPQLSAEEAYEKVKLNCLTENTFVFNNLSKGENEQTQTQEIIDDESCVINIINSYNEKTIHGDGYVQKGDVACPRCHKDDQVNTKTMQTASLDEGHTVFGYCKRCKKPFIKGHK